jgi:acetylornithine/N-succinyldiaminopimelate aminotransferase
MTIQPNAQPMPEHALNTLGDAKLPITLKSAEGALIWDVKGQTYWDFYGGHAVTLIGQGDTRWVDAIAGQARSLAFFTTLANIPVRERAAAALCEFTQMDVAWFVNSGSEATEAALKIVRKATGRPVIVSMQGSFHGRTMGALGVTWKYREQHAPVHGDTRFIPFGDEKALEEALDESVAALIVEPVQGMAGIVEPPAGFLRRAEKLLKNNGSWLICDEVQCGMGRMGWPLVSIKEGLQPDIITVGKGVGGGFPVAAVLMTQEAADSIAPGEHGTTFGGGPMACAAVEATLQIIEEDSLLEKARVLGARMKERLNLPFVKAMRGDGAWIGLVLDRPAKPIARALVEQGFLVGTAIDPKVLRLSPPAVMPLYAVELLGRALEELLG